jgi:hypothetical protein
MTEGIRTQNRISDLAGSWEVSDEEVEEIRRALAEGWERWH